MTIHFQRKLCTVDWFVNQSVSHTNNLYQKAAQAVPRKLQSRKICMPPSPFLNVVSLTPPQPALPFLSLSFSVWRFKRLMGWTVTYPGHCRLFWIDNGYLYAHDALPNQDRNSIRLCSRLTSQYCRTFIYEDVRPEFHAGHRRNLSPPSSELKSKPSKKAAWSRQLSLLLNENGGDVFSGTLVVFESITRRYVPGNITSRKHRREKLISYTLSCTR
jgi:hypothetical protein